ncbi:hypothetical protein VKT23_010040 [Stygiomarasmius scandens]|uniref:Cytochrome P450 n=1 Tax=Marasmiellus scandens TaxID=2682957 RepID=A0ABR1JFB9_9AGAR
MELVVLLLCCLVIKALLALYAFNFNRKNVFSLPPGPKRWPFVGSLFCMPKHHAWQTFSRWKEQYGNVIYLDVVGTPIVVINSVSVAKDLLDKRSAIYSDRPHLVMACELQVHAILFSYYLLTLSFLRAGLDQAFPLKQYGEAWRTQRKLVSQHLSQSAMPKYHTIQESEARKFVSRVLSNRSWTSETLKKQVELGVAANIFSVTYGYPLTSADDSFLKQSTRMMDDFSRTTEPGAWLVDTIPQLKRIPAWMPGSGFLKTARDVRSNYEDVIKNLFKWTRNSLDNGAALPSICSKVLSSKGIQVSDTLEEQLSFAAFSVLGGGLDTNISTIMSFILAMILHPDIQARARTEIDDVIGKHRLPTLNDKESLPFVRSVITEVMRLYPAVPLGLPHSLQQDDVYHEMYLPKKSIVLTNVWHMLRDPEVFDRPEVFNPDRYGGLDSEMQKVTDISFGFGRRVCPGRFFAENSIFSMVTTLLATCEILPPHDASGKEYPPESLTVESGTIVFCGPFECTIVPRPEGIGFLED